jgi:hypothetical protein
VDASDIVAGTVGAVLGALFTVGGTWWVSVRLDRQREHRELIAAIGIVAAELEENRHRVANGCTANGLRQRLTLADWASNKGAFASLALRDEALWEAVVDTYGAIHEFRSGWRADHPSTDQLSGLVKQLHGVQRELRQEIRAFSRFLALTI